MRIKNTGLEIERGMKGSVELSLPLGFLRSKMEEGIWPLRKRVEEAFIASSPNGLGGGDR